MATLEDIIMSQLRGSQGNDLIAQSDPYADFAGIGSSAVKLAQSSPTGSLKDKLILSVLGGVGGGLFGGLSKDYVGRATNAYNDVLSSAMKGQEVAKPSVLDDNVFAMAKQQGNVFQALQSLNAETEAAKNIGAAKTELIKGIAQRQDLQPEEQIALAARVAGSDINALAQPAEPIFKKATPYTEALEKYGSPKAADLYLQKQIEAGNVDKSELPKMADSLRTELLGKPELRGFQETANRYQILLKGKDDPSAVSDYEFATNLAKIYDPTSVVRPSETGQILESQAIPSTILGTLNRAINGQAALGPQVRGSLINSATRFFSTQKDMATKLTDEYSRIARERGINPSDVVIVPGLSVQAPAPQQDLSAYTPTQIAYMKSKGLL